MGVAGDAGPGGGDLCADQQQQGDIADAVLAGPGAAEQPQTGQDVDGTEGDPGERVQDGVAAQTHREQHPIGVERAPRDLGEGLVEAERADLDRLPGIAQHLAHRVGQSAVALGVGDEQVVVTAGAGGDHSRDDGDDDQHDEGRVHADQQTDHGDDAGDRADHREQPPDVGQPVGLVAELVEPIGDGRVLVQRDRGHLGGQSDQVGVDVAPDLVVHGVTERPADLGRQAGDQQGAGDQGQPGHQRGPGPRRVQRDLHPQHGERRQDRPGDGGQTEQRGRPEICPEAGGDPQPDDAESPSELGHRPGSVTST